jgi:uncharacterized protein (TIGR03437 family)
VNGEAAPMFYAGPNQVNFQVPFDASGSASVSIGAGGVPIVAKSIPIRSTAPGIFLLAQGQAGALNQDNSVNGTNNPAAAGSVIAIYATGLGAVNPPVPAGAQAPSTSLSRVTATVSATIGGQPATVDFAGLAPGFAGLYQVNLTVPQLSPGTYGVQITAGGVASNTATIAIH